MKKVILAFEGTHFSDGAFEFANTLNRKEKILLTGIFLPQVILSNLWSYADSTAGPLMVPLMEDENAEVIQNNVKKFQQLCTQNNIDYCVHKDFFDFALPALKKETRFADLLILGSESFYKNIGSGQPNEYLKEAIHGAECPVILVPEKYAFPAANILAYDGSESSVFAIKQFAYLLPEFAQNPTLLVSVSGDKDQPIQDKSNIEELALRHFPDFSTTNLDIDSKEYFASWISEKKNSILVSGSFGRSSFAIMFRKSFSADVIAAHQVPVFITHK